MTDPRRRPRGRPRIDWEAARATLERIAGLAARAGAYGRLRAGQQTFLQLCLEDVHFGACPLRLDALEQADDATLWAELQEIRRHFDIARAQLMRGYWPQFAVHPAPLEA